MNDNAENDDNFFKVAFDRNEETHYDSDVNSNDYYDENDFFNDKNEDFINASAYPVVKAPSSDMIAKREYII